MWLIPQNLISVMTQPYLSKKKFAQPGNFLVHFVQLAIFVRCIGTYLPIPTVGTYTSTSTAVDVITTIPTAQL